ncbi:hypothetical protein BOTCAL_0203g00100 [Botryotinia calthae]|uniref:Uncharacterized protein n=1 Tax=Botryotinia calthae TaxID=38488 RepID=A0A4Y8CZ53_9HELO|nr:hypothetical protein BOTCAL_0203g00100 [Botryotinia calthae]
MAHNRDEASFPVTSSRPSDALYEYYGLTYRQWIDYMYPEGPLDVINARLEAVNRELGSARTNTPLPPVSHAGWPNLPQSAPYYLSPPPHPQNYLRRANYDDDDYYEDGDKDDDDDNTDDPMVNDGPGSVAVQSQARDSVPSRGSMSTVAKISAEDVAIIGTKLVEAANSARAATMASLTKEARTATLPHGVAHRDQLDFLRNMPLRRQLSLRYPYQDFYRTRPDYWDATAGYLVGEVALEPCSNCKAGNGPFPECIVVPLQPESDKQPFGGVCMSCAYQSSGGKCSLNPNRNNQ